MEPRQGRGAGVDVAREGLHLGRTFAWEAEMESKFASVTLADVNRVRWRARIFILTGW